MLGKFSDLPLLAVETHPAMLFYLDNVRSIGPQSFAGMRQGKGLNENLAREILGAAYAWCAQRLQPIRC